MTFRDSNFTRAIKNAFLPIRQDIIVLESHFGLGDNLVCLGLMRELSRHYPKTRFNYECLSRCYHSLTLMADEIHTIDTALVHFVESLFQNQIHKPFFYHLTRKSPTEFTRRLPWQVIRYWN